jgi:hypothetical protein
MPKQLLKSHQSADGNILNALNFPLLLSAYPSTFVASDLAAWQNPSGITGYNKEYPFSLTRWRLAATTGAYTKVHLNCDGSSTYLQYKAVFFTLVQTTKL